MTSLQQLTTHELMDDQVAAAMLAAATRAHAYVKDIPFELFVEDVKLQDAVAGCVLVTALAQRDLSEQLINWVDAPWFQLAEGAEWQPNGIRSPAHLRALYEHVRGVYPRLIEALQRFDDPPTE